MEIKITFSNTDIENLIKEEIRKQGLAVNRVIFSVSTDRPGDPVLVSAEAQVTKPAPSYGCSAYDR